MEKRPEDYLVLCRLYLENNMSERLIRLILDGKLARGDTFLAMEFRLVLARAYVRRLLAKLPCCLCLPRHFRVCSALVQLCYTRH